MELISCPNCFTVYADVQDSCPNCEADHYGDGARVEFDSATRTAISQLGGLFGGILEPDDAKRLLWCARGVCLYSQETGLVWKSRTPRRVEEVRIEAQAVRIETGGKELLLDLRDGEELPR